MTYKLKKKQINCQKKQPETIIKKQYFRAEHFMRVNQMIKIISMGLEHFTIAKKKYAIQDIGNRITFMALDIYSTNK